MECPPQRGHVNAILLEDFPKGGVVLEGVLFFVVAVIGYFVCGYIFRIYSSSKNLDSFASFSPNQEFRYRDLLVVSILVECPFSSPCFRIFW